MLYNIEQMTFEVKLSSWYENTRFLLEKVLSISKKTPANWRVLDITKIKIICFADIVLFV